MRSVDNVTTTIKDKNGKELSATFQSALIFCTTLIERDIHSL